VNEAALAVFVSVSTGAFTGVGPAVPVQRAAAGQVGSPPPEAVALLVTLGCAAAVGVTGMMMLLDAPTRIAVVSVQVTVWPAAVQPPGSVPMVRPVGIVSVTVMLPMVVAVPVLVTVSV
jgi:hypothetical protein